MTFTHELVDHLKRHRGMVIPLVRQCEKAGFSGHFVIEGEDLALRPYIEKGDFAPAYELAAKHARPSDGALEIRLHGKPLTSTAYDQTGHSDIRLAFLEGAAREFFHGMPKMIAQVRRVLMDHFETQTIFDLIDFGADYLSRTKYKFSYTIIGFNRAIFEARLERKVLKAAILDPVAYIRLGLFMLKGADALALSFRNPFDILAMLDTLQASLRHLATSYAERELRIEVSALGQKLLSCGHGIRSNLMTDRFGPTSLHLDAIFKILSSALAGAKEAAP